MADDLLTALMGQPQPQVSPIASGLAGFGAGVKGQVNPVLAQQAQMQEQGMRDRLAVMGVMQSAEKMRTEKQKGLLEIGKGLLSGDSPQGRLVGAKIFESALRGAGTQLPPNFAEGLAAPHAPSLDARKQAYLSVQAGATDDYLVNGLHIPKEQVTQIRQEAGSPAIHKMLFGKTLEQEKLDQMRVDLQWRQYERMQAADEVRALREQRLERRGEAMHAEAMARIDQGERRLKLMDATYQLKEKEFAYKLASGPEEKRLKALDQADLLANQMEGTSRALETSGYLPPPGASIGNPLFLSAKAKRVAFPNDPEWQLWTKHLQPAMIGYARSVQNDIGPRAMMAFQGAMQLMENPPDQKSIQKVVDNMRIAIRLGREGKDTAQFVIIKHPNGMIGKVPWKRGMSYDPGDAVVGVE